jgi:hypothetical protein
MISTKIATVLVLVGLLGCGGTTPVEENVPLPDVPSSSDGPQIGFFGVLQSEFKLIDPVSVDQSGRPIYARSSSDFVLVVDAKPGRNGVAVGRSTFNYNAANPAVWPDLQIEASRNLGNGSGAVCDHSAGNFGGVPGINPPSFALTRQIADALNDFGCHFDDGAGQPLGHGPDFPCVQFDDGEYRFVDAEATVEFCATIISSIQFPPGDTLVTARVRDESGVIGPARQIIIRVRTP